MKKLPFKKMHGIGNDYIMLEDKHLKELKISLTTELIQDICQKNF